MKKVILFAVFFLSNLYADEKNFYCKEYISGDGSIVTINLNEKYIYFDEKKFNTDWTNEEKGITVYLQPSKKDISNYAIYYDVLFFNRFTGEMIYEWHHSETADKDAWNYILPIVVYFKCNYARDLLN